MFLGFTLAAFLCLVESGCSTAPAPTPALVNPYAPLGGIPAAPVPPLASATTAPAKLAIKAALPKPQPVVVAFSTEASAIIGLKYILQSSTNLHTWINVATFPADGREARYTNMSPSSNTYFRAGYTFR
jgi:hypothetical protein